MKPKIYSRRLTPPEPREYQDLWFFLMLTIPLALITPVLFALVKELATRLAP